MEWDTPTVVTDRTLLTFSDVLNRHEATKSDGVPILLPENSMPIASDLQFAVTLESSLCKADREWTAAIATLEKLLLSLVQSSTTSDDCLGIILSGTAPILSHAELLGRFQTGVFTPEAWQICP
jgi:hypothetical protein